MSDQRGLVVSPPIVQTDGGLNFVNTQLDPQELRSNLLFWDKLDFPSNNMIALGLSPDAEYLMETGILGRTAVRIHGFVSEQAYAEAHVAAFRALDEKEPGTWSLATGERSISFPDSDLDEGRGVLVSLHGAIPVPDKDVPLNDILEFKERRRAELLAFRHHLERIYQRIRDAGDGALALKTETESLEAAIADHIKASREARFGLRLSGLNASINLVDWTSSAVTNFASGMPLVDSVLRGATSSIGVSIGVGLKRRAVNETPFKYVTSYNRELFT